MPPLAPTRVFPQPGHNHSACVAHALERAAAAFEARGLRLTDLRRHVFEEIAASHHSVGAYDILERLAAKGTRLAPISVYRAIDALIAAGVVHRLESKNAYFACHNAHSGGAEHLVLACEKCGAVAEVAGGSVFGAIDEAARGARFQPRLRVVEVAGLCGDCGGAGKAVST
jgi:Fur family zinc uptake transcriptional regulator